MKYYGKISDPKDLVTLEKTQNLINQSTSGTEDASNKVTEWSSPTTNTHYPSEKLVKNSLDTKQNTLTAGNNINISGNTISAIDTTYSAATTSAEGLMSAADKVKLNGIAEGATANIGTITGIKMNGASKGTSGVVDLGTVITAHQDISGKENTSNKVTSISSSSTDAQYPSAKAVYTAVNSLPKPMQFKGSLGTGGTITALPTASTSTVGYTYKVITAGTYASIAAKVGDVFVCNDTPAWVLIPSGDEPSGTVTSVGITNGGGIGVSGSPITSSGSITITNAGVRSITQDSSDGHKLTINTNGSNTTITIPDNDTTYSAVTTTVDGLMSAADKSKLDGIASGATSVSESTVSGWGFTKNAGTITGVSVDGTSVASSGVANINTPIGYYTCDTAAATVAKVGTYVTGAKYSSSYLPTGAMALVKFTNANSVTSPTLNLNSSGAKALMQYGTTKIATYATTTGWNAGAVCLFVYDGTNWVRNQGYNTNSTYNVATQSANGLMSAADKTKLDGIAEGATANTGTVTSVAVSMNGSTKGTVTTSGTIDLGTVITAHQSASTVNGASVGSATKGTYINSSGKPTAMTYSVNKDVPSDAVFTDTNQTIKGAGTAFGANAAVDIVAGDNVTITPDATNNKITIASSYTNTDTKVQSAASTTNVDEPILLNNGTSATTSTVLFKSGATINPSTGNLKITQINGVTVGSSPKFTDNNTTYSFAGGDGQFTVTPSGGSAQTVSIKSIIQVLTEDPTSPVVGEMWITP